MADELPLDSAWLRENPLPDPDPLSDKNARGRVFLIGGSATVPGGLLLTAEAALRAGAGKVQVATTASTALALGMAMPEIAVFPLDQDDDGEIAGLPRRIAAGLSRCDIVVAGPEMGGGDGPAAARPPSVGRASNDCFSHGTGTGLRGSRLVTRRQRRGHHQAGFRPRRRYNSSRR